MAEDVGKCAEAGAKARYVGGVGAQRMVRGYGYGQVMVRCSGGVGCVMCGRGCEGVGAWVWLRAGDGALRWGHRYALVWAWVRRGRCVGMVKAGDGVLQLRFKCVSAGAHIC